MPLPDFTDDELYLINYVKSTSANAQSNSYMWGYLVGGAVLAAFGAYQSSVPMILTAFILVAGFRIYEEMFQSGWTPIWRSIIEKYEAAAMGEVDTDS
jgi:predicted alpha/beta-fold hydrolase